MAAMAAITLLGACSESDDKRGEDPQPDGLFEVRLEVEDITSSTAKLKASHGDEADRGWIGHLTADASLSEQELVAEALLAYHNGEVSIHRSKQYVEILSGLEAEQSYKYVAFGLTESGERYGKVSCVEFTTLAAGSGSEDDDPNAPSEINGMRRNDDWMIRYIGQGTIAEKSYDNIVSVKSFDNNPYAITVVYADYYDPAQLRDVADLLLEDMRAYLDQYNAAYGSAYTIGDMLYTGDASDAFDLDPGRYRALAIGYTSGGAVSGLYAVSEEFEVKESIATKEYKAWLGEWSILGANNVTCNITLEREVANKSFLMRGWEGFPWPVRVEYDTELDALFFYAQLIATDYDLGAEYGYCDIYFLGSDRSGYYYTIEDGEYYIGIAGILDDGQRAIVQFGVNTPGYPAFKQMFFMAHLENTDEYKAFHAEEEVPTYISAMSPVATTTAKPRSINNFSKRVGAHIPAPRFNRQRAK